MNIISVRKEKERLEKENAEIGMYIQKDKQKLERWRENRVRIERMNDSINAAENLAKSLMDDSQIGKRFRSRTFETWDKSKFQSAYDFCYKYANEFDKNNGDGIILMGGAGTGKTHLASAIANYLMHESLVPVKFGTFANLLDKMKLAFHTDKDVVNQLSNVSMLIIDDLGKEKYTEWAQQVLFQVIDNRYNNELPLIITTNLRPEELRERFGEPIVSRLMEMCYGIAMNGDNYRYEKAIQNRRPSSAESTAAAY